MGIARVLKSDAADVEKTSSNLGLDQHGLKLQVNGCHRPRQSMETKKHKHKLHLRHWPVFYFYSQSVTFIFNIFESPCAGERCG